MEIKTIIKHYIICTASEKDMPEISIHRLMYTKYSILFAWNHIILCNG